MKAAAAQQLQLLELQRHEIEAELVAAAIKSSPVAVRVEELTVGLRDLSAELVRLRTEAEDLTREIKRAEQDLDRLQQRKRRDEQAMNSGASAKVQRELAHEAQALQRRIADAEDAELDLMERQEGIKERLATAEQQVSDAEMAMTAAQADRDSELIQLRQSAHEHQQAVTELAAAIATDLISAYRQSRNAMGIAAAQFVNGRCLGCRLSIPPVEAAAVEAAAADEVVWCDECGCILIRDAS
ncbi:MAG: hypothetical protein K0U60_04050 [Actinomycetia bacterium]|nr:hypothetical protein [Actinomycetes bacterium]MCH9801105.1 hypothetical protein [Actinomycetes bacterium]